MYLTKLHIKALRYIRRCRSVMQLRLENKFGYKILSDLHAWQLIRCDYVSEQDADGFEVSSVPSSAEYYLSDAGAVEVEARDWFDMEFVIRNIILPIAISVVTSLILCRFR